MNMGDTEMKKRIIGFVLLTVMAISLFGAFCCSASADSIPANATEVIVVAKGDTMYSLCQKNGFSYATYMELLMKLNNISDESKLAKIYVGKKLVLPTSKAAADALCQLLSIDTSKKTAANGTTEYKAFSVLGDATKIPAGDSPKYYIISYTMQSGDTVSNLLKTWGMSFKTYSQQILNLNNLSDFNHIAAGRKLYMPVTDAGLTDGSTFTVCEHTVKSGDTAYSICKTYGMDYNKALSTLKLLNANVDFTKIKVGQKLYIPVSGVVALNTQSSAAQTDAKTVSGYGVVVSYGDMIRIRRENVRQDLGLKIGKNAIPTTYVPKSGDYVYFTYTTSDNTLVSIKYVYNVFTKST